LSLRIEVRAFSNVPHVIVNFTRDGAATSHVLHRGGLFLRLQEIVNNELRLMTNKLELTLKKRP